MSDSKKIVTKASTLKKVLLILTVLPILFVFANCICWFIYQRTLPNPWMQVFQEFESKPSWLPGGCDKECNGTKKEIYCEEWSYGTRECYYSCTGVVHNHCPF